MAEAFVRFLIAVALVALCVVLFFWVMSAVGFPIPSQVQTIIIVIAVLVCILFLFRFLRPHIGGWLP